jgi:hypothetical protein
VAGVIGDRVEEFVADLTTFAHDYAERVRRDHELFVAAFRSDRIPEVSSTVS